MTLPYEEVYALQSSRMKCKCGRDIQLRGTGCARDEVGAPCSAYDTAKDAFLDWWNEQVSASKEWSTVERCAAKDAWDAALRWAGYYDEPNRILSRGAK